MFSSGRRQCSGYFAVFHVNQAAEDEQGGADGFIITQGRDFCAADRVSGLFSQHGTDCPLLIGGYFH
ncbi:hypothetical protein K6U37_12805 [Vibrio parahaemolyticus]|uniref:hypothetical protein n=1 Tax=Vibrio parahaemolyticus TaxID=670 RepID=UPI001EEB1E05|nr:hypothetical protein [Vibrio parahaemolyticus]MCG6489831.1 hypothetical protein [Vibrio parahaemolyticus]